MDEAMNISVQEESDAISLRPVEVVPVFFVKPVRKVFSRIGLGLSVLLLASTVAQILLIVLANLIGGPDNWLMTSSWGMWITTFAPLYAVAMPLCIFIMHRLPAHKPRKARLGGKNLFIFTMIFFFLSYCGNFIGIFLSGLLSGGTANNTVADLAMDTNPLKILVMVILAPLLEEYIFRRQIIDRTVQYGEKVAVFLSAFTFALLHGNLFQFFYTFAGGLVLGYIYVRTGRLRYTVIIHSIMNFMGSVVAPFILTQLDLDAIAGMDPSMPANELMAIYGKILPGMLLYLAYLFLILVVFITGLVLFIVKCRKLVWKRSVNQLPKGTCFKTVYWNVGMVLFVLICGASMVLALFA